jgi:hypothetical protein
MLGTDACSKLQHIQRCRHQHALQTMHALPLHASQRHIRRIRLTPARAAQLLPEVRVLPLRTRARLFDDEFGTQSVKATQLPLKILCDHAVGCLQDALGPPTLSPVASDRQLDVEEAWLADMIQTWQDEEWQPQVGFKLYAHVHAQGSLDSCACTRHTHGLMRCCNGIFSEMLAAG